MFWRVVFPCHSSGPLKRGHRLAKLAGTALRVAQYESEVDRQCCRLWKRGYSRRVLKTTLRMRNGLKICILCKRSSCRGEPVGHRTCGQLGCCVMLGDELRLPRGDFWEMAFENFGDSFVILAAPAE